MWLRDEDLKFVLNVKNVVLRVKDWKAGAYANAY